MITIIFPYLHRLIENENYVDDILIIFAAWLRDYAGI